MKKNILWVLKMATFYSLLGLILQGLVVNILVAFSFTKGQYLDNIRVTINAHNVTFEQALKQIEKQTDFTFFYVKDEVPFNENITIDVTNESLYNLLQGLAGQYRLVFQRINNQIAIKKAELTQSQKSIVVENSGKIKGKVISVTTQEPLIGANIILKGTSIGTTTDEQGFFTIINVPEGSSVLEVRYLGYKTEVININITSNLTLHLDDIYLITSNIGLDEILVTANIVETERRAIPSAVTTISSEEIKKLHIKQISELFRGSIPGGSSLDLGARNFYTNINLRGTSSLNFNTVKTYIDGVEVNDDLATSTIDPNSVETIEVLRGPQASTLFGSGASGGVISIITKKGKAGKPSIQAKLSSGIIESEYVDEIPIRQDYSLNVTGGVDNFTYNVGGTYLGYEEYIPESESNQYNFFAGMKMSQDYLSVGISGQYANRIFGSPQNSILVAEGLSADIPVDQTHITEEQTLGITVKYLPTEWWQHNLTFGFDQNKNKFYTNSPRHTNPFDTLVTINSAGGSKASIRYNTSFEFNLNDIISSTLIAGFDYSKQNFEGLVTSEAGRATPLTTGQNVIITNSTSKNRGYFSQLTLALGNKFYLTGGIRVEDNENFGQNYGTFIAPRLGATYVLDFSTFNVKPRVSYGKSLLPPSPGYNAETVASTYIYKANPDIGPEQQVGFDGGFDLFSRDGSFSLEVTYYNQEARDLISTEIIGFTSGFLPILKSSNTGIIKNEGWEFATSLDLGSILIKGTFTITSSKVKELGAGYLGSLQPGDQMLSIPKQNGGLSITYVFPALFSSSAKRGGSITLGATYIGEYTNTDWISYYKFLNGLEPYKGSERDYWITYESFVKLKLGLDYALTDNINVFLNINNLLNRQEPEADNITPTAGRISMLGIQLNY